MQIPSSQIPDDPTARPMPAFTLGTALLWAGHQCITCPTQATEQMARMWLIDPPPGAPPLGMRTMIEVEFLDAAWSPDQARTLMAGVNGCTGRDRIHVRERSAAERLAACAATTPPAGSSAQQAPPAAGAAPVPTSSRRAPLRPAGLRHV